MTAIWSSSKRPGPVDPTTSFLPPDLLQHCGERNRTEDLTVNITREKKLTNMRSSTSDATVTLRPPRILSLDQSIEFIAEDELVEVTPKSVRLRKMELNAAGRALARKKQRQA